MPSYTIESTYRLPVFRHRTYEAASLEDACRLATADTDWAGQKEDHENATSTYLTGIWPGTDTAYMTGACPIPQGFGEPSPDTGSAGPKAADQQPPASKATPVMPRCRHCGSADIFRDANACWNDAAQAWSLLATYDSQTCGQCGADSNNLALWVSVVEPDSAAAFRWDVIQILEDTALAGNPAFQRFCDERHGHMPADDVAAHWRTRPPG